MTTLWPPLAQIRAELQGDAQEPYEPPVPTVVPLVKHPETAPRRSADEDLLAPLLELARRREAARAHWRDSTWEPGCVVLTRQGAASVGVLLDHEDASGTFWNGWLTSAEPDWAAWHDVLLEPGDEPADPGVAVIQAWNRVRIPFSKNAPMLARLSSMRLAAVREVWAESDDATPADATPYPGHIALRETAYGHMVLTGTPLGTDDPRREQQALYQDLGQRLTAAEQETALQPAGQHESTKAPSLVSSPAWWSRLRAMFRPDGWIRPAFALLALVVVGQQWVIWQGGQEDEVRFRGGPPQVLQAPALVVRWAPATQLQEAQALIGTLTGRHDISVLPDGRWLIELDDPQAARNALSASRLVESVEAP